MKSTIRWINKFSSISVIVSLILFIVACGTIGGAGSTGSTITSADNVTFYEGVPGTFTVTAIGDPKPTFTLIGSLPYHLIFDDKTGVLSGTPAIGISSGTYSLTITASNAADSQKFTLTVVAAPKPLIVTGTSIDTSPIKDVIANLNFIMKAAILNVQTSTGVPAGSLSGYAQIWDIRYDNTTPLTPEDITSYTTYLAGGGTLVVIGENISFDIRNNSISSLISALGGGSITILGNSSDAETVQPPFNSPNSITTVSYDASAYTGDHGTGTFITERAGGTTGSALYFKRGTLSNATAGRLMVVFDVNWMEGSDPYFNKLIDNMVKLP
jgi:hypothetical protein